MSKQILNIGLIVFAALLLAIPSFADSQARIVRLSQVDGDVQVDRDAAQGYEKAFLNMPITAGMKLRTNAVGRAEIEFEDGSTLRIVPHTNIAFPELSLRDSGAKVTTISIQDGTAYLNFTGKKDDEFTVSFAHEKVALTKPAHIRVEIGDTDATLAVFKGDVQVEGPSGAVNVEKRRTATFDLADQNRYALAKNLEPDPYDDWDKQEEQYHQRYTASNSYSPYSYGVSDLAYYGNYINAPGYGMCWQPYFTGLGWDPFMNGAWMWYPGFGYTWVSGYPWGWTPYRYGSWVFLPAYGWVWQPGYWTAWRPVPLIVNPPRQFVAPRPPAAPGQTVIVNRGPVTGSGNPKRMLVRNDSAGLGIPRGSVRNLGSISQQVKQDGFAETRLHRSAPGMSSGIAPAPSMGRGAGSRISAPAHSAPSPHVSAPSPHR
jgi:uncharacterized protein DUF6600/FecR-like protein